jgi:hypothetical protein
MSSSPPPPPGTSEPPERSEPAERPAPNAAQTPLERADSGHQRLEESVMWNAVSYLISGPVLFGGIGWGLDRWLGTSWLVAVGILGGMALSLYLIWFRYGTQRLQR